MTELKHTPLTARHVARGARLVPFAGYAMPVQYIGVIEEHVAVRRAAGVFDVSHMGELVVRGAGALDAVNAVVTNDLRRVGPGRAQYTLLCQEDGGIVDDLIAYIVSDEEIFLCVNAATRDGDRAWLTAHLDPRVELRDESEQWAQLAVQGPRAADIVAESLGVAALASLKPFRFLDTSFEGWPLRAATTGYTGSGGLELYVAVGAAERLWDRLFQVGSDRGLLPIGLGARDTLRLEMGYCLYGSDIDRSTTPWEAALEWVVRLDKGDFVGRNALVRQQEKGVERRLVGIGIEDRAIARAGYTIVHPQSGEPVGRITSGTRSPSLERPIALGYVPTVLAQPNTRIEVEIRGKRVPARVEALPFYTQPLR